jgi:hypothetical protein
LSEDSVFLGDSKSQTLENPQAINAYAYSSDNPVTKSDPSGKCIEDACVGETVASIELVNLAMEYGPGILGGIGNTVNTYVNSIEDSKTNPAASAPNLSQYASSFAFGFATGQSAEISLFRAGLINAAASVNDNLQSGQKVNV